MAKVLHLHPVVSPHAVRRGVPGHPRPHLQVPGGEPVQPVVVQDCVGEVREGYQGRGEKPQVSSKQC